MTVKFDLPNGTAPAIRALRAARQKAGSLRNEAPVARQVAFAVALLHRAVTYTQNWGWLSRGWAGRQVLEFGGPLLSALDRQPGHRGPARTLFPVQGADQSGQAVAAPALLARGAGLYCTDLKLETLNDERKDRHL